jgi:polyphenol oxidase
VAANRIDFFTKVAIAQMSQAVPPTWKQSSIGFFQVQKEFLAFFGNKNSSIENIQKLYPKFSFSKMVQTHSADVLFHTSENSSHQKSGDAHYTDEFNQALLISTADCIPLLIFVGGKNPLCAAIHAGWRGVEQKIVYETFKKMRLAKEQLSQTQVFIGPHIQQQSFEVGADVRDRLLKSAPEFLLKDLSGSLYQPSLLHADKFYFDLHQLMCLQIMDLGLSVSTQNVIRLDTVIDQNLHSHRRDARASGRQHSFIVRIDS